MLITIKIKSQFINSKMLKVIQKHNNICSSLFFKCIRKMSQFSRQDIVKAQQYVQQTLRSRSWIDYMISNYYPKPTRKAYIAIQLFNLELTRIADNIKQPSLGLGKLEFWRNTINKIYNSQLPNSQPISICLNQACYSHPLTKGYFDRIINAKAEQLSSRSIQTMDQLLRLARNNFSTLIALNIQLLGIQIQKQHEDLITKMGHCIGICTFIRRVPFGLRNHRYLVPLDILSKHNVQNTKIWNRIYGKPSQQFFDAVLQIAAYAKKQFQESVQIYQKLYKQKRIHPQVFRAFLKGVQIELYLKDLQKYNFNLFDPRLVKGHPFALPLRYFKSARNHSFYYEGKID